MTTVAAPEVVDEVAFAALKAEIAEYVETEGERWTELIEAEGRVPQELWTQLRDRGYLRLAAPREFGGAGLPFPRYLELLELFARPHASLRMIVHVSNGTWRSILPHANADQLDRFVAPLIRGDLKIAFTLTEPHNGTGADITTYVEREGDHYYLTGEKWLITFGHISDYLLLFARMRGSVGAQGTVALLVPSHGEGVTNNLMGDSMGVRGTDHAHLFFDRAPVPVANRLGAEGDGLTVALGGFLVPSRISVAMTCVGLAQKALDLAVAHAKERITFGKPIASRQAIAFRLAEAAADLQAARQLTLFAAAQWESGAGGAAESAQAKLFASEMLQRVTDHALSVFGGAGYFKSPIERVYRDARAQRFEEGTVEVQKQTIARELLA
ncbi:acyl-CoA dehydrogenase family protein [Conexibacter sp. DBS9H8]|uniref:acyl-CoA dehydrogenase family protein n=1 Tax=Conexibacter sp. DBS9H8 TaxID=2937801 RepID=UPI00200D1828|nr:acyl-CoA dehydrogenase family protein [Conexibacter sp. DBS9H8]